MKILFKPDVGSYVYSNGGAFDFCFQMQQALAAECPGLDVLAQSLRGKR
jgi:hypothetical protein